VLFVLKKGNFCLQAALKESAVAWNSIADSTGKQELKI